LNSSTRLLRIKINAHLHILSTIIDLFMLNVKIKLNSCNGTDYAPIR
jgi:hypothetical protein